VSKIKNILISAMAMGLLAGSAVGVAAQDEAVPASASAGCDAPLVEPGEYEGTNDFEDAAQGYWVVVPADYAELAPAPLILFIAMAGESLDSNFEWWRPYLGPAESVFVVAEQNSIDHKGAPTLTALIDQLGAEYCIDTRRVHAMGQSTSGKTVAALACDASDRIGSFFVGIAGFDCTPEQPVPFIAMTGDSDRRAVTKSVEARAEMYSCGPDPIVEDLGSGVTRTTYQGCQADIVLYDVEGVGHGFIRDACLADRFDYCFQNDVFDQLREVERFFAEHPLPAAE
jgi:dienelactone hydrolase